MKKGLHGSYEPSDVTFLLTPVRMDFSSVRDKEVLIQSGARHYSEMLSPESAPSPAYMAIYDDSLRANGLKVAQHINTLADALASRPVGARGLALTSLARAGTPIGILLTRALRRRGVTVCHYSVSIIRDRGIDGNALRHILERHDASDVVFVDGWTGKGAIAGELRGPRGSGAYGIEPYLIVLADPPGLSDLSATFEDYVIPSGILNGIVSGLLSRSVLNDRIGPDDFHGSVRLDHLQAHDLSRAFVDTIDGLAQTAPPQGADHWSRDAAPHRAQASRQLIRQVADAAGISDINRIKPGIAEATRAVLRRLPHSLLLNDRSDPNLRHLVQLAQERDVALLDMPASGPAAGMYRAIAIIAETGGD